MKAGIFKTTDGTLLYVGKDQYIRASLGAKSLDGYKVVYSKARDAVSIVAAMTNGHRIANVRNGFNRSAFDLLHDLANKVENPDVLDLHGGVMRYEAGEANDDDFSLNVDGNDSARETMREGTLVPPADAPEGDPVDLDPELAAYHGEADDSDREAVNLLPDDVSPAQSLHEFVAERLHRIDTGGAAPPVFVDKPLYLNADGVREVLANKEQIRDDILRKVTMPKELFSPYCGLPPQTVFLSTPSDAKRFVEEHLQPKFEAGGVGGVGLRENEIAMPVGRLAFPLVCERQDEQLGVNLFAKGTFTAEVTLSPQVEQHFRQAIEAGKAMHEQMVNDFLTDRIEFVPGVSDEVLWHNDEDRERLARERLARGEFRLCHAAAARKHKKKRDRHVWWHPVFGCYAWKKIEARA